MANTPKRGRLTTEEQQKYLDDDAQYCPYCHSDDLGYDKLNFESGSTWQDVTCLECNRIWQDVYKLVEVSDEFTFDEEAPGGEI